MKRKAISCVLVASLLLSIGCYYTGMPTKDEFKANVQPVDITVLTKDSLTYKFPKGRYHIQGDTLSGFTLSGFRVGRAGTGNFVRDSIATSIALADITSIETSEFSMGKTLVGAALIGAAGVAVFFLIAVATIPRD